MREALRVDDADGDGRRDELGAPAAIRRVGEAAVFLDEAFEVFARAGETLAERRRADFEDGRGVVPGELEDFSEDVCQAVRSVEA